MCRQLIFGLILIYAASVRAAYNTDLGVSMHSIYEGDASVTTYRRTDAPGFYLSYKPSKTWRYMLEFDYLKMTSSAAQLQVSRTQYRLTPWVSYIPEATYRFKPYLSLGLGLRRQDVDTYFVSNRTSAKGSIESEIGFAGGLRARWMQSLITETEARFFVPPSSTRQVSWGWSLRFGTAF